MAVWVSVDVAIQVGTHHRPTRGFCVEEREPRMIAQAYLDEHHPLATIVGIDRLPYPAEPRVGEKVEDCPPFCWQPEQCAGRGSCPRPRACDD